MLLDKENIIISIIIVLCIAAAVAAYGLTNSNNPIFSDLSSMSGDDASGHGPGNNSTAKHNHSSNVATTARGGSGGTSSGGSGSGGSGSGSGSGGSGGGDSGGGGSGGGGGSSTHLSYAQALSIVNDAIQVEGAHAEYDRFENGYWIFRVYDSSGNHVDSIGVNDATGMTERI